MAQSDESLLIESASTEKMLKLDGTALLFPSAKLETPGARTGFWESYSEGRLRLDKSHELNPVIGYSYFEVGPGGSFGPVDGNLIDVSVAFSTPVGTIGDWY